MRVMKRSWAERRMAELRCQHREDGMINQDLVKMLRGLCDLAETGKLTDFAGVGFGLGQVHFVLSFQDNKRMAPIASEIDLVSLQLKGVIIAERQRILAASQGGIVQATEIPKMNGN
jgi:hypothetical protein